MIQKEATRVALVQGYCLLRDLLVEKLEQVDWIDVCGMASSVDELPELVQESMPQVLVINVSLKCCGGIAVLKDLKKKYPEMGILAFSCDSEFENMFVSQVLWAGADGYIASRDCSQDLVMGIWSVKHGGRFISESLKSQVLEPEQKKSAVLKLSKRETEVFVLLGSGHVPKRIAQKLNLSGSTIDTYIERTRSKLGMRSGADLQHTATTFMRAAGKYGDGKENEIFSSLFSG